MFQKAKILLFFSVCLLVKFSVANAITLDEALLQKKISCTIKGNKNSTHYYESIALEVNNLSAEDISIDIKFGDMFIPINTIYQNIVVTENKLIVLKGKTNQRVSIKGMCTESSNSSGNESTVYTFKKGKDEKLSKLAGFIAENKYQNSTGQLAVWTLLNNENINNIISSDSSEEGKFKKFLANLTGKTYSIKVKDYKTNYYAPPKEKVGGMFEYTFAYPRDVQIAMFNDKNILVRELFNQKNISPGTHKTEFAYDASIYTDDIYYFKLIANNKVFIEQKWDAKAMRDAFKKKIENRQ